MNLWITMIRRAEKGSWWCPRNFWCHQTSEAQNPGPPQIPPSKKMSQQNRAKPWPRWASGEISAKLKDLLKNDQKNDGRCPSSKISGKSSPNGAPMAPMATPIAAASPLRPWRPKLWPRHRVRPLVNHSGTQNLDAFSDQRGLGQKAKAFRTIVGVTSGWGKHWISMSFVLVKTVQSSVLWFRTNDPMFILLERFKPPQESSMMVIFPARETKKHSKSPASWIWLVGGFTSSEKYVSQLGWSFPIYGKIKHIPNHQPVSLNYESLSSSVAPHCS